MNGLILGTDYETRESIISKCDFNSVQALNHRRRKLTERGEMIKSFRKDGKVCYLKKDADLLINYQEGPRNYPKNRKEPPKGTRPGKQKVKKEV